MNIEIHPTIEAKIAQDDHGRITPKEVFECFENHCGTQYCNEQKAEHNDKDGKPCFWFVADTNHKRRLKIMFVIDDGEIHLKSAYPATDKVFEIYQKYAK